METADAGVPGMFVQAKAGHGKVESALPGALVVFSLYAGLP
jgi:hypothetical protein